MLVTSRIGSHPLQINNLEILMNQSIRSYIITPPPTPIKKKGRKKGKKKIVKRRSSKIFLVYASGELN